MNTGIEHPMYEKILELNRQINAERDSEKISALLEELRKEMAAEKAQFEQINIGSTSRR